MALLVGVLGIVAGTEAVHYTAKVGASGNDFTGLLAFSAALLLLSLGAVTLGRRGGLPMHAVETMITAGLTPFSNGPPPPVMQDIGVDTESLNPEYFKAAGESKTLWEIPESKRVGGLAARPAEYERRVVGFFDDALLA